MSVLSVSQVHEARLDDWVLLRDALHTRLETGSWAAGVALVNAISVVAEESDHHPDLDLRYGRLDVVLSSHDVGGVTGRDVRLARKISALAADAGVRASTGALSLVEIGLDTPEHAVVRPFWKAVLSADAGEEDEVRDSTGRAPSLWFQQSASDEPRQRFHIDVVVPTQNAEARIAAAVAAGGTVVSREDAPRFVVLADPDGNKACICTMEGR